MKLDGCKRQGREKPAKIEQRKVKGRSEDRSKDFSLQPGDRAGVYFPGRGGFCPHQSPQRMLLASSPHSWSLSLSTLTPWRSHPSAEIAWIDTSRPPPAVAQCGRGRGRLLSPKLSSSLLPLPPRFSFGSLSVSEEQWVATPHPLPHAQAQTPESTLSLFSRPMWKPPGNPLDPLSR